MRRITGRMRIMVALIALLVTSARLITPPAFATPTTTPAIEQIHTTDGGYRPRPETPAPLAGRQPDAARAVRDAHEPITCRYNRSGRCHRSERAARRPRLEL